MRLLLWHIVSVHAATCTDCHQVSGLMLWIGLISSHPIALWIEMPIYLGHVLFHRNEEMAILDDIITPGDLCPEHSTVIAIDCLADRFLVTGTNTVMNP